MVGSEAVLGRSVEGAGYESSDTRTTDLVLCSKPRDELHRKRSQLVTIVG
jgi:hypothetical protein